MAVVGKILLALLLLLILAVAVIYLLGSRLPVNHVVSVTGIVQASPQKIFALITDLPDQPQWRRNLRSTELLPPDAGRDHWREHFERGDPMTFLATQTRAPNLRVVEVQVPGDAYGGKWTYQLTPSGSNATTVTITEDGYVRPAIYRFVMVHILGPDSNLKRYLADLQAKASKP